MRKMRSSLKLWARQETHLDGSLNREMIRECWGDYNFEFAYENASAYSCSVAFVNVYGPQSPSEKRKLWEELLLIKNSRSACWIVFGDFNVVRRQEERINSMFRQSSANYFNKFIELAGFHEPKMGVTTLPRDKSDHCPILLSQSKANFGPLPFKLFNSWLTRQGFNEGVSKACREFIGFGPPPPPPDSRLLNKLKAIKKAISEWRSLEFSKESAKLIKLKEARMDIDKRLDCGCFNDVDLDERTRISGRIEELERLAIIDLKQKSRIKWTIDRDENSCFFHGYVSNRLRRNHI
ncbi:uncharacterized protein LOC128126882 [Lactuca sativa]|uniref:uncharacterized protein LOC128126882 n=1 Tax=Lactuca sativa TaxID=4236 RepID=UPI0022B05394|nr:uncharacterized protein LOC128126882 [Lactuca sativa]